MNTRRKARGKDASKEHLLTGAGLIDAKVVQVDAANDLALLKANRWFAPLPIAASRTGLLGGTVATVGFPNIGLQGFAPGKGSLFQPEEFEPPHVGCYDGTRQAAGSTLQP